MICNWPDPYPDELFYSIYARYSDRNRRFVKVELFVLDVSLINLDMTSCDRTNISILQKMDDREKVGANDL